jgi:NTE family protein
MATPAAASGPQASGPEVVASKPINLALQGGGAHGALTWGVLDKLLEDDRLLIRDISGTSAGAMNAVALADGYARAGRDGARESLGKFWRAVSDAAMLSPIRRSFWDQIWGRYSLDHSPSYLFFEGLSRVFSPYEINPLGYNPLRDILAAQVDFNNVNDHPYVRVYVTATNARTGRPRIFGPGEITVDSVMASACIPQMFPAVEIDGEAYWDGGFSGNPALYPLVISSSAPDIVVVQVNPLIRHETPRTAREIINRVNEISFNSALIKELRSIAILQRAARGAAAKGLDLRPYSDTYLHLIHVDTEVEDLSASSKLNAEWSYLRLLFERGRSWASGWLDSCSSQIGNASTLDLEGLFGDQHLPAPALGARRPARAESWPTPSPLELPV